MALRDGSRLGPLEILAQIGAGAMGDVYRARDTRLNRDVAIKVLPDVFASDAGGLARFRREVQTLAALNHPNIAHIHGIEESSGVHALIVGRNVRRWVLRRSGHTQRPARRGIG